MMTHMKTIAVLFLGGVVFFNLSSCGDDNENIDPCVDTDLAVTFTSAGFAITAEASGGTAPYQFSVDGTNFQASANFELPGRDTITLTVRDANDCEATVNVTIDPCVGADLAVTFIPTGFAITAEASGGTTPYEFSIDGTNFQSSADFDLPEGDAVTLTVRDANNCEASVNVSGDEVQSVLDTRDGRVYSVFKSGDQLWLGENLRYRPSNSEGTFCFDDIEANCEEGGVLYNFAGAENACLAGWVLATEAQWQTLIDAFGGDLAAGVALREGGTSGFDAELAGVGTATGSYSGEDNVVQYWIDETRQFQIRGDNDGVSFGATLAEFRNCVRCIKE